MTYKKKYMVKDAPVMELTIRRLTTGYLHKNLQSLGYYSIKTEGKTSEWRRSNFHLHTYPFGRRGIKLSLHKGVRLTSIFETPHAAQLIFSPDVIWALIPAVAATLKNAVPTLRPIKKPRLLRHSKPLIRARASVFAESFKTTP